MAADGLAAIVTGAAQGFGFATSERLLQEGYKVCLADVNESKGKESLAHLQAKYSADKVIFVKCDVTSETSFEGTVNLAHFQGKYAADKESYVKCDVRSVTSFEAAFSKTQKEFGRIDLLVNNAGAGDEYRPSLILNLNLMGPIIGCQLALKYMGTSNGGKGGVVINVASIVGLVPSPFSPVYCATKHGVVGYTRSYGDQYHLDTNGVFFMAICPHGMRTDMINTARMLKPVKEIITTELMETEYVAEGIIKLLKDKKNGSTLAVLPQKMEYIGLPSELENLTL